MTDVFKVVLSLSLSGSLVLLVLWLGEWLLRGRLSRQWSYYLYLIVIARLLLPFTLPHSLMSTLFAPAVPEPSVMVVPFASQTVPVPSGPAADEILAKPAQSPSFWQVAPYVWLAGVLLLLVRKVTVYQSFVRYLRAGWRSVDDIALLEQKSQLEAELGIKRPVELYTNELIASPLLVGIFRPYIVLPSTDQPEGYLRHTLHHELMHHKRRDLLYKWLVQLVVCLYWFDPLLWLAARRLDHAGELSCDEAVLRRLLPEDRRTYGDTLLYAAAIGGDYKNSLASATLSENGHFLKERLDAIMSMPKRSRSTVFSSCALTLLLLVGAVVTGAAVPAADKATTAKADLTTTPHFLSQDDARIEINRVEKAYATNSLSTFGRLFANLTADEQATLMEMIYTDGKLTFFSESLHQLPKKSPLIATWAEKTYTDGNIAFFSIVAMSMSMDDLNGYLDRALDEGRTSFQLMLLDALDRDWEKEALEEELAHELQAEYAAYGITQKGKDRYYEGNLVNVFLDIRADHAFYTLDMNPLGTVNIKVIRTADGAIERIVYMTDEEVEELFGDWDEDEATVPIEIGRIEAGESVWLGTYNLAPGDQIAYHTVVESKGRMTMGFAKPGIDGSDTAYCATSHFAVGGKSITSVGPFSLHEAVEPGAYQLFIRATSEPLTNILGNIIITRSHER